MILSYETYLTVLENLSVTFLETNNM